MKRYKLFVVVDTGKKENRYMSGVIIGKVTPHHLTECNFYTYKSVNLKDIKNIDSFVSINIYFKGKHISYKYIAKQIKTILKYNRIWVETSKSFIKDK